MKINRDNEKEVKNEEIEKQKILKEEKIRASKLNFLKELEELKKKYNVDLDVQQKIVIISNEEFNF